MCLVFMMLFCFVVYWAEQIMDKMKLIDVDEARVLWEMHDVGGP